MTEADLAKTLEGRLAAYRKPHSSNDDAHELWSEMILHADEIIAALYRTGQLIVVDHPQATSPVDDRGGAVCKQQVVEAVARAIYGEDDFVGLGDDTTQRMFAVARKAIAAMPSVSAKDAARYRWLRDHSCPPHNFYISVPDEFHGVRYAPSEVDAYIDAARQALGDEA